MTKNIKTSSTILTSFIKSLLTSFSKHLLQWLNTNLVKQNEHRHNYMLKMCQHAINDCQHLYNWKIIKLFLSRKHKHFLYSQSFVDLKIFCSKNNSKILSTTKLIYHVIVSQAQMRSPLLIIIVLIKYYISFSVLLRAMLEYNPFQAWTRIS